MTDKNELYKTRLIEGLYEHGLDCLVPLRMTSFDEECNGHQDIDEEDDCGYYYYRDDESEEENAEYKRGVDNLDQLMLDFGCDTMEVDEFLDMGPWELFSMSKNQFRMIDFSYFDSYGCERFLDELNSISKEIDSIEKRIKWATVATLTYCKSITWHNINENNKEVGYKNLSVSKNK